MQNTRKIVGVSLAVALAAALAAYVLMPKAGPNAGSVVVNEPTPPGTDAGGSGGSGGTGTDTGPGPPPPESLPPPAHGKAAQNSQGPRHAVCPSPNGHVPDWASDEGANRYRGTGCMGPSSQGHGTALGPENSRAGDHGNGHAYAYGHEKQGTPGSLIGLARGHP